MKEVNPDTMKEPGRKFFWLHIKKSAGISTRRFLKPHYKEVDRGKKPKTFIQADISEYNDILNNYRVPLGEYQFRRALFAKTFLFPDQWDSLYSFAFAREPVDRCVSMFFYLYRKRHQNLSGSLRRTYYNMVQHKRPFTSVSFDFDHFLDLVEEAHTASPSIYQPKGLHFTTHTAPMFGDVTDEEGKLILTRVFRLENLSKGLQEVYKECGLLWKEPENIRSNRNVHRKEFKPSRSQIARIEELYSQDFELYERAH